jgi:hypothetical protein
MAVKAKGPIAEEYARLAKKIKGILKDSSMPLHVGNLGHLLHSYGIIKQPKLLYSHIEDALIRAIIDAKINDK